MPRSGESEGKRREVVKVDEGQVVEKKHDVKCDILAATSGGTLVGAILSHVVRGFGLGLAGSAVYVLHARAKKSISPHRRACFVRMDNTVAVPMVFASNAGYSSR